MSVQKHTTMRYQCDRCGVQEQRENGAPPDWHCAIVGRIGESHGAFSFDLCDDCTDKLRAWKENGR